MNTHIQHYCTTCGLRPDKNSLAAHAKTCGGNLMPTTHKPTNAALQKQISVLAERIGIVGSPI